MTVPDYVGKPYPPVHNEPPKSTQWQAMTQDQLDGLRKRLIDSIIQIIVQLLTGGFIPGGGVGGASNQLTSWATDIFDKFLNIGGLFGGADLSSGSLDLQSIWNDVINGFITPSGLIATIENIINTIFEAIFGVARDPAGDPTTDLGFALTHIPFANVLGIGGPANIGDSVSTTWDQIVSGLVGMLGSGAGLADIFNTTQQVSSTAALGGFSWDILGIRNNRGLNTGFLPTTQSNIGLDTVALQGSAPTFALTQSTAVTGYHRISQTSNYGVVSWHGSGVTSVTDAFVNIFEMDTTTGDLSLVHASSNIVGSLSGSMQQNVYTVSPAIPVTAGEVYGVEVAVRGAGTHSIVGTSSWLPDQTVFPRRFSSVRNSGTSAPPSTLTPSYGSNVPFIEFGVTASTTVLPHSPEIRQFSAPGSTSYPIPSWANFVDRVVLGGGGGGHQGATLGIGGAGGGAGTWASDTLTRGTDFTGSVSLTTVVGAPGAAGVGGNGGNGGTSSSDITSTHTISSTGGVGSTSIDLIGTAHTGASPGNYTFPGGGPAWTISGGAAQNTYGADGNPSGGAGAGGNWISIQPGGAGAPGTVYYRFRQ